MLHVHYKLLFTAFTGVSVSAERRNYGQWREQILTYIDEKSCDAIRFVCDQCINKMNKFELVIVTVKDNNRLAIYYRHVSFGQVLSQERHGFLKTL